MRAAAGKDEDQTGEEEDDDDDDIAQEHGGPSFRLIVMHGAIYSRRLAGGLRESCGVRRRAGG
jgi:hypothetical protein